MEDDASKFKCYRCAGSSGFTSPVFDSSGLRMEDEQSEQARIYRCEFCRAENEVLRTATFWRRIDSPARGNLPITIAEEQPIPPDREVGNEVSTRPGAASSDGRPPADDSRQRERLESSLDTIRTQSAVIGTTAMAVGAVLVKVSPGAAPVALRAITLFVAVAVALVGFGNAIPLRQTPQPTDKVAQLARTLGWRHQVLIGSAAGLALAIALMLAVLLQ